MCCSVGVILLVNVSGHIALRTENAALHYFFFFFFPQSAWTNMKAFLCFIDQNAAGM